MHVAIGSTVLRRGYDTGHIDGIATYTQELLKHYELQSRESFTPATFEKKSGSNLLMPESYTFPHSFARSVLQTTLTGLPFNGSTQLHEQFDIFHATDHMIPKLRHTPVVATLMDAVPLAYPEWVSVGKLRTLKNWLFKHSSGWADHYLAISEFAVNDLIKFFQIPEQKISVIHLGVDDTYFDKLSDMAIEESLQRFQLTPGFFLFIGTIQPRKNLKRLIDAFSKLPRDVQLKHPLVVVGRNGWRSDEEIAQLHQLEREGVARWLNYISPEDKKALLQTALALVFPSLYEGFGLPILEAFASNLPVITSNTTSLPEVAGGAALLIDPLSTESITHAILELVNNPSTRVELQNKGLYRAQELTWQRTADKTWAIYKKIIAG